MAKEPKASKEIKAKAAPKTAPKDEAPKYAVAQLADELQRSPAEVRALLRRSGIEKPGGSWGWTRKSDFDSVLKTLKGLLTSKKEPREAKA